MCNGRSQQCSGRTKSNFISLLFQGKNWCDIYDKSPGHDKTFVTVTWWWCKSRQLGMTIVWSLWSEERLKARPTLRRKTSSFGKKIFFFAIPSGNTSLDSSSCPAASKTFPCLLLLLLSWELFDSALFSSSTFLTWHQSEESDLNFKVLLEHDFLFSFQIEGVAVAMGKHGQMWHCRDLMNHLSSVGPPSIGWFSYCILLKAFNDTGERSISSRAICRIPWYLQDFLGKIWL